MTGWDDSRMSLATAVEAPLSAFPKKLSASSRTMSFLPPDDALRKLPSSEKVSLRAPPMAILSISPAVLWSEAFISTIPQPISLARASAEVVFPTPGDPMSTAALTAGVPSSHDLAHDLSELTAVGFPMTSESVLGLYLSVQSMVSPPVCI